MMHRVLTRFLLVASLCLVASGVADSAAAQATTRPGRGLLLDIIEAVYPAELVMRNAERLSLDEAQREAIVSEVQSLQNDLVPLQWEIYEEGDKLQEILGATRVEEKRALEQAARVMTLEQKIKQRHLAMLVRVKNLLSSEQQEILDGHRGLARLERFRERLRERWQRGAEPDLEP